MKPQIIIIHGGDTFKTYKEYLNFLKKWRIDFKRYKTPKSSWKNNLNAKLDGKFEVILPDMPDKTNAKYLEWKIWFQKFIPYIKPNVILIGHSLGGLFLAKYLSENKFPKKIAAVFLVAAPYDDNSGFRVPKSLKKFQEQAKKIFIYHSKNDRIVPFSDSQKYEKSLKTAVKRIFINRGHFRQKTLPELIKDIKSL